MYLGMGLRMRGGLYPFPTNISGMQLWLTGRKPVFQDTGYASPAVSTNDPIGDAPDRSGNGINATQGVSANRPTLQFDTQGNAAIRPNTTSAFLRLARTITVRGPFTLYVAGARSAGTNYIPLGDSGSDGSSAALIFSDDNVYYTFASGNLSTPYTGSIGSILARWRRDTSNNCYFAVSGMTEVNMGVKADPLSLLYIGARPWAAQFNGGSNQFAEIMLWNRDLVASGDDPSVRSYLQQLYGLTIP